MKDAGPSRRGATALAALALLLAPAAARAQDPAPRDTLTLEAATVALDEADLAILATVRADEVRVDAKGSARVAFSGSEGLRSEFAVDETNLPEALATGVVYRDVVVQLRILTTLADVARFLEGAADADDEGGAAPERPR